MLKVKDLLAKMLNNTPQIRYGSASLGSVNANSYKDVPISFDSPMNGTPVVVCSMRSTSTSPTMGGIDISPIDASSTGFTARIFNNTTAARSPAFDYVAFYGGGK